jgi:hypothetical protein
VLQAASCRLLFTRTVARRRRPDGRGNRSSTASSARGGERVEEIRKLAELVEEAGTDLAFIQAVNAVAGESGDATTVEVLVRYVDLTDRFRSDFGPRLEKRVATALDELAAMDDTAPGDATATPSSPVDRKRTGQSETILLSSRSTRAQNEEAAGDEEPIADAPKKSRGARRTSVGAKDYDGALLDASRGVGALQAREDAAAEAPPPPPPILAPQAPAASSGGGGWRAAATSPRRDRVRPGRPARRSRAGAGER